MSLEKVSENKSFGGRQLRYSHQSAVLNCAMHFSIYLPAEAAKHKVPVLYWLSGLTCTDENFVTKAGAQQFAAQHGVAIVAPDTSPRGEGVPDDDNAGYDFGLGAGFYVDATQAPWSQHYHMYSYITQELPALINSNFAVDAERVSIFGHSMGGHGALTIALKNASHYKSVSAFAPISSPMRCPWGEKALGNYIGTNKEDWRQYDATELVAKAAIQIPMLVDQGTGDNFLTEQLKPELLQEACAAAGYPAQIRLQEGYDHSYFFMSSFMADHLSFHAKHLNA
ncbi:S-formylglutathione hydrolase [Dasania marina]|uniref:S-formylglutathione hydrolase n=1 Tax=Dasania marina TaxID=471499 RepID=UPI0030DA78A7|tara:strand:- start:77440 stop:78285 length:846 start_codon:yes stop_codon:yes gene_type:complete